MRRIIIVVCLLTIVLGSVLAACNGGKSGGSSTATPVASSDQSSSPSATTDSASAQATSAAIPDPFASLKSYHYTMQMTGDGADSVTIKGSIISPDSVQMDFYLAGSDTPVNQMIIIGQQAWMNSTSTGEWQSVAISDAEGQIAGLLPKDFWGSFPFDQIVGVSTDLGQETVNGIDAHHYQINEASPATLAQLADIFGSTDESTQPQQFSMDLWRASDGWPVKATISATYPAESSVGQASISWEVSDANSSSVTIQPPA
jgi:hypothetical protein